jgi:hypothetical protein
MHIGLMEAILIGLVAGLLVPCCLRASFIEVYAWLICKSNKKEREGRKELKGVKFVWET